MDWIKPLINVIKDAVIAIIGYMSGKAAAEKKQAECALKQVEIGNQIEADVNSASTDDVDRLLKDDYRH